MIGADGHDCWSWRCGHTRTEFALVEGPPRGGGWVGQIVGDRMAALDGEADVRNTGTHSSISVESGCGAVVLGNAYLYPPLSFGGASIAEP